MTLAADLRYWRRALRLMDWDITLHVCRHFEMPERLGECAVNATSREARIRILDPRDISPDATAVSRDVEVTLVHELLHVLFPQDEDGWCSTQQEQAIDTTARALVNLRRFGRDSG